MPSAGKSSLSVGKMSKEDEDEVAKVYFIYLFLIFINL